MSELKKCKCGGEPRVEKLKTDIHCWYGVTCTRCGAGIKPSLEKEQAVKLWNVFYGGGEVGCKQGSGRGTE